MLKLVLPLFMSLMSSWALAEGTELFVCTDAKGVRTYQNSDAGQGCTLLNLNPITVVPSPKERMPRPKEGATAQDNRFEQRIDPPTQNLKRGPLMPFDANSDRLKILQEELRVEERKLGALKDEYKDGQPDRLGQERNYQKYLDRSARLQQDIKSSQDNIDILKREIGKLQRQ